MTDEKSVCITDFCGYLNRPHIPLSYWADWFPERKVVVFGGDWKDVPDMPADTEPTEELCDEWVNKHHGSWWIDYDENTEVCND